MKLAFNAFALAYFLGILPSETSPKKKGQGERNTGDKKNQKSRIFAYMKTTFDFMLKLSSWAKQLRQLHEFLMDDTEESINIQTRKLQVIALDVKAQI